MRLSKPEKKNTQSKQLKSNLPLMGLEPLLLFPRCLLKLLSKEKRKVKKRLPRLQVSKFSKSIFIATSTFVRNIWRCNNNRGVVLLKAKKTHM